MEYLIIIVVTCITLGSQLLLKKAITTFGAAAQASKVDFILAAISSPYVLTAILLQGIGFMLWIFVLSKMKLGLAFATSGAFFYILIALSSWYLYGEELSIPQWVGLAFISLGVILISYYQG